MYFTKTSRANLLFLGNATRRTTKPGELVLELAICQLGIHDSFKRRITCVTERAAAGEEFRCENSLICSSFVPDRMKICRLQPLYLRGGGVFSPSGTQLYLSSLPPSLLCGDHSFRNLSLCLLPLKFCRSTRPSFVFVTFKVDFLFLVLPFFFFFDSNLFGYSLLHWGVFWGF